LFEKSGKRKIPFVLLEPACQPHCSSLPRVRRYADATLPRRLIVAGPRRPPRSSSRPSGRRRSTPSRRFAMESKLRRTVTCVFTPPSTFRASAARCSPQAAPEPSRPPSKLRPECSLALPCVIFSFSATKPSCTSGINTPHRPPLSPLLETLAAGKEIDRAKVKMSPSPCSLPSRATCVASQASTSPESAGNRRAPFSSSAPASQFRPVQPRADLAASLVSITTVPRFSPCSFPACFLTVPSCPRRPRRVRPQLHVAGRPPPSAGPPTSAKVTASLRCFFLCYWLSQPRTLAPEP
jgi:hypothetical protein